jgi:predicted permease
MSRRDDDIGEEIRTHLDMAARDRVERGESHEEARFAAMREFGNVALVRETTRQVWISSRLEQLVQDLRFGMRILWQAPALSMTAVALIALVIGGNTTVYAVVRGLVANPPNGVAARNLVVVKQVSPESRALGPYLSFPNYRDYASKLTTIRHLSAYSDERMTLGLGDGSYAIFGALVTPEYFRTLGVETVQGRALGADDDRGGGLVGVISHRLWSDRFQQSPAIVGTRVFVNGLPVTIAGVAAPRFLGASITPGEDVWLPITTYYHALGSQQMLHDRRQPLVTLVGQLAEGRSRREAGAEIAAVAAQLQAAYPIENKDRTARLAPYSGVSLTLIGEAAPQFLAVFSIITALTLLIVAANVANLMLARAVVRQREVAVRQSLGASRWRILRMLVAEGLTIALVAWIAAFVFAWWMSRALGAFLEPAQHNLLPDISPDWQVAGYAMLLALVATLAFTLAPALRSWRQPVLPWLKAGEQAVAPGRSRLSSALVVVQLAFCVVLLTSAAIAVRSLAVLDAGDVGFSSERIVVATLRADRGGAFVSAEPSRVERQSTLALLERIRERLMAVPNVEAVSYARRSIGPYFVSATTVARPGAVEPITGLVRYVGPGYLDVLRLKPSAGRALGAGDRPGAPRAATINANLAAALWPGGDALGQTLLLGPQQEAVDIVGIIPNAFFDGPSHDRKPNFVLVAEQQGVGRPVTEPKFLIRYNGSLDALTPAIRKAVAEVDAGVPVVSIQTLEKQLASVAELERQLATLLALFAIGSLVVAVLGQYAVAAFSMRRRTRDFGVRLALGASARRVQASVVVESMRLTSIGLLIGFALSSVVAIAVRRVLAAAAATDPVTYVGVLSVLAGTSLVASYLPAWRAGRVNVVEALRQE